jgi:hypothetical protein
MHTKPKEARPAIAKDVGLDAAKKKYRDHKARNKPFEGVNLTSQD